MSFTYRTITHAFLDADSSASVGEVTFDLTGPMTNGGTTIEPGEVTAPLVAGALSVSLAANDDTGTVPTGQQWVTTLRFQGEDPISYLITVPSVGSGAIDLGSLLPGQPQVG